MNSVKSCPVLSNYADVPIGADDLTRAAGDFAGLAWFGLFSATARGACGRAHRIMASELDRPGKPEHDAHMNLEDIRSAAIPACRDFNVRRLDAFGSMVRNTATARSDVDLLVEFRDPDDRPAHRFFGLLHRLQDGLGCKVDLLTVNSLRNPYFRQCVMNEKVVLYEG